MTSYLNLSKCKWNLPTISLQKPSPVLLRKLDPLSVCVGQAEHRGPSSRITSELPNQHIPRLTATRRLSSHHVFGSWCPVIISPKERFQGELAHYEKSDHSHLNSQTEKFAGSGFHKAITYRLNLWTLHTYFYHTASQAQVPVSANLASPPANSEEKDLCR